MIIDLSKTINERTKTYVGDPKIKLTQIASIKDEGYNNYELLINMHAGTHVDGPYHMDNSKGFISEYGLEHFCGKARLVYPSIPYVNEGEEIVVIDIIGTVLSEEFVSQLINNNIKMIVVNDETIERPPYFIHKKLFKHSIMIVENAVNLDALKSYSMFDIFAIPLKIEADSSPIRLFAIV